MKTYFFLFFVITRIPLLLGCGYQQGCIDFIDGLCVLNQEEGYSPEMVGNTVQAVHDALAFHEVKTDMPQLLEELDVSLEWVLYKDSILNELPGVGKPNGLTMNGKRIFVAWDSYKFANIPPEKVEQWIRCWDMYGTLAHELLHVVDFAVLNSTSEEGYYHTNPYLWYRSAPEGYPTDLTVEGITSNIIAEQCKELF